MQMLHLRPSGLQRTFRPNLCLSRSRQRYSIWAISVVMGSSMLTGDEDARAGRHVDTQHSPPIPQQDGTAIHLTAEQPAVQPAVRPSSPFAAMAGHAFASGSLSGSFSVPRDSSNAVPSALVKGLSSGGRFQSADSLLSSDSRLSGLQQAECGDTSSSEEDSDADRPTPAQILQVSQYSEMRQIPEGSMITHGEDPIIWKGQVSCRKPLL